MVTCRRTRHRHSASSHTRPGPRTAAGTAPRARAGRRAGAGWGWPGWGQWWWSHLMRVRVWVSVGHLTSAGLKWQSDTERREHCAETRGRRGRRMNMRWIMVDWTGQTANSTVSVKLSCQLYVIVYLLSMTWPRCMHFLLITTFISHLHSIMSG